MTFVLGLRPTELIVLLILTFLGVALEAIMDALIRRRGRPAQVG